MARKLDLDAVTGEATDEPLEATLRGRTFTLPPSMPVGLPIFLNRAFSAETPQDEDKWTAAAVESVFGDRTDEAMRAGFTLAHLVRLATSYGLNVDTPNGEVPPESPAEASPASARSSKPTGKRSRPTSKPTTGSTSAPAASEPTRSEPAASSPS
jgi:hypothetical protein